MPAIKGTASVTDSRARQKALRKTKFPRNFGTKVLLQKVNKPVLTQWIEQKVTSLLGFEDEIVASTAINLFLPSDGTCTSPDAKKAQLDLVGFLGDSAATFSKELWSLMLEAQKSSSGIPQTLLEQKKKDMAERMNRNNNQQQQLNQQQQQQQQQYHQHRSQNNHPPSVPIRTNGQNDNGTSGRRRVNRFSRMNQDRGDDNSNNNNRPAVGLSVPISAIHEINSSVDQDGIKIIDQPTQRQANKQEDEFGRALPLIVNKKQPPPTETEDKQDDRAKSHANTSTSRRRNGRSQSRSRSRSRNGNMDVRGRENSDIRRRSANRDTGRHRGANDDRRFDDRREHDYNYHQRHDHYYDRDSDRDRYYYNGRGEGDRYYDDRGRDRNRNRHSYHYDDNNREMDNLKRRLVHLKQQGNRSTSVHKINEETTNVNDAKSIQERIYQLEQRRRRYPSTSPRARDDDDYRRRSSRSYQDSNHSGRNSHHQKDSRRKRNNSVNSDSSRSMDSDSVDCADNKDNDDDDKGSHLSKSPSLEVVEGGNKNKSKKKRQRRQRSRSCSDVSDK
jgi:hypothetical protein